MGHYLSEMGGGDVEGARRRSEAEAALAERGYSSQAKVNSASWKVELYYQGIQNTLRLHAPCGTAVFDPDTHDKFCPARDEG